MDYEKLHKDTLAGLQRLVSEGKISEEVAKSICADFVAESEDERIRKEIIAFLQSMNGHCNPTQDWDLRNRWLPYLEKQKEQQPVEWSEEDESMLENVFGTYKTLEDMLDLSTGQDRDILESMNFERGWLKDRFKSLRPQPHWKPSEEQMEALKFIITDQSCPTGLITQIIISLVDDLKKLM